MIEEYRFYKETYSNFRGKRVYYISNFGNVKVNDELYECTKQYNKNIIYKQLCHKPLHRIIAELFIPNPDNLPEIDHIDGNGLNNRVDNLRWCDRTGNMNNPLTKAKLSENKKSQNAWVGEKNPNYGGKINKGRKRK